MSFVDEMSFKDVHMDSVVNCIFIFVILSSVTKSSPVEETILTTEGTVTEKINNTSAVNVITENSKKEGYDPPISRLIQVLNNTTIPIFPMNITTSAEKPALRHHVAHFCPNLDIARICIRKCMKYGAPAFCGKDHICYCGHRYGHFDNSSEVNVLIDPVPNPYEDIYKKYFGPNSDIVPTTTTTASSSSSTSSATKRKTTTTTTLPPTTTTEDPKAPGLIEWIDTNITDYVNHTSCAVIAGYRGSDGFAQIVVRAVIANSLVPGKLHAANGGAYIGWGGMEHRVLDFEICCVKDRTKLIWKHARYGNLPKRAILAGYTVDGVDLYVGRAAVLGEITPGAVHPVNKAIYIAANRKEVVSQNFEVLCRKL